MKFASLLKKELREMITVQTIVSMIAIFILLVALGSVMGDTINEITNVTVINICDNDKTEFTTAMINSLESYGYTANVYNLSSDNYCSEMNSLEINSLIIIPSGFTDLINEHSDVNIDIVTLISKGGYISLLTDEAVLTSASNIISTYIDDYFSADAVSISLTTTEYTSANNKTVQISAESVVSMLMGIMVIAPMIVFVLLTMASQTVVTAIASEKADKTLETLLSAPVSRISVLSAKMLAALIVALMNAIVMSLGMLFYISSLMISSSSDISSIDVSEISSTLSVASALTELGLSITASDVLLFGVQIFMSIAIGLAISLMLGAMATDVKSSQTLVLPVVLISVVPYMITMFSDIDTLPTIVKAIIYLIPFTHSYIALNNVMFGDTGMFIFGVVYQLLFLVVCMYLAVKLFTTDKLFTMKIKTKK